LKKVFQYFILNLIVLGIVFFGFRSYSNAIAYEDTMKQLVEHSNISDLTKDNIKNISEKISFGLYKNKTREEYNKLKDNSVVYYDNAVVSVSLLFIFVFVLFLLYFFIDLKIFNIYAVISTIIILFFGIITPLFMVTIHKEFTMIGDVVLSFESKSLIGSVFKMFDSGNYVLAIVILFFSIVVPVLKMISLLVVSLFKDKGFIHKIVEFFKLIGKWSMIDVFVVAVLLVFFTARGGEISRGELEVGIYMFLMYVIASMILSISVLRMIKNK